jgi:hypothetical protein
VIRGDAHQLPALLPPGTAGRAALVVTSPPYGPSVHGQVRAEQRHGGGGVEKYDNRYSHDPANLAHHGLDDMLAGLTQILAGCKTLLRPGGLVVVTARPWRHRGELVDLPAAVLATGASAGLIPAARCVALLAGLRGGKLIPRPSFFQLDNIRKARRRGEPWHLIVHEDVRIFRNPPFPGGSGNPNPAAGTGSGAPRRRAAWPRERRTAGRAGISAAAPGRVRPRRRSRPRGCWPWPRRRRRPGRPPGQGPGRRRALRARSARS